MKLYSFEPAPNPRRTRIFIAEKGLAIPVQEVNLRDGEQHGEAFSRINPTRTVPVLELDDGTCITESMAICRYLEELYPQNPLLGDSPLERAQVEMWVRRIEFDGMLAIAEALRNFVDHFRDRAVTGPDPVAQIPALAERGKARAERFFARLQERLAESPYVAGEHFSMADISAFVTVDFAAWVKLDPRAEHPALEAWYQRIAARPSSGA